ncbi:MAG TPA: exodeoxyribonuclease VII small subunit [Byssovorax sp.]
MVPEREPAPEPIDGAPATDGGSFEAATRRLADIVTELERGDLPLERSLALFEEGVHLARVAGDRLDHAERRVDELLGIDAQGKPVTRPARVRPAGEE